MEYESRTDDKGDYPFRGNSAGFIQWLLQTPPGFPGKVLRRQEEDFRSSPATISLAMALGRSHVDKVMKSPVARKNALVFWVILQQREYSLLKSGSGKLWKWHGISP